MEDLILQLKKEIIEVLNLIMMRRFLVMKGLGLILLTLWN